MVIIRRRGKAAPLGRRKRFNWKINLINTGKNSMTGGRVKRMQKVIGKETCLLTYGDGLADIDINKLFLKFL